MKARDSPDSIERGGVCIRRNDDVVGYLPTHGSTFVSISAKLWLAGNKEAPSHVPLVGVNVKQLHLPVTYLNRLVAQ